MSNTKTVEIPGEAHRRLVSLNLACGGWETALKMIEDIHLRSLPPGFGLFEGCMTAACVLYGRPFKPGNGLVKLKEFEEFGEIEDGVELRLIHDAVLQTRDKVLAHNDYNQWPGMPTDTPWNAETSAIRVHLESGGTVVDSASLLPPGNLHELMPRLVSTQIQRVRKSLLFSVISSLPTPPEGALDLRIVSAATK